jgi:LysM repeat protein
MAFKYYIRNCILSLVLAGTGFQTYSQSNDSTIARKDSTIRLNHNKEKSDSILHFAMKHIGMPYRCGGKGPKNFDCSGYTGYIFSKFGYNLNASSTSQYLQGTKLDFDEIERGDLVFFKGRNSRSSRVGHVGIVCEIDKENKSFKFVHAAVNGGVKIDQYPDKYYYGKRYVGAKRIIEPAKVTIEEQHNKETVNESINEKIKDEDMTISTHIVQKGDNLYRLSKKYNCTVEDIINWNNLKNIKLSIGEKLNIKIKN